LNDPTLTSHALGQSAGGVLVIGYGNALRSDDGVGWHAAALLAEDRRLAGVEVLAVHQLTPELALDMSRASLVILVDATVGDAPGAITVRPLAADDRSSTGGPGASSHHVGPGELLAVAGELYGAVPEALVVSVGVADMEPGEALSPAVAAALPAVANAVVGLIARHRGSRPASP
jgi:hydrogenase maturation protease